MNIQNTISVLSLKERYTVPLAYVSFDHFEYTLTRHGKSLEEIIFNDNLSFDGENLHFLFAKKENKSTFFGDDGILNDCCCQLEDLKSTLNDLVSLEEADALKRKLLKNNCGYG